MPKSLKQGCLTNLQDTQYKNEYWKKYSQPAYSK